MTTDEEDPGMRNLYARHPGGSTGWFIEFGSSYENPHEDGVADAVRRLEQDGALVKGQRVLDLATGSGEVWRALRSLGFPSADLVACDPYTGEAFLARTGHACRPDSFADIAAGSLAGLEFDVVICAYALHLCEGSRLPGVCMALTAVAPELIVVSPHKRPRLSESWGWRLTHDDHDPGFRIRTRRYSSN